MQVSWFGVPDVYVVRVLLGKFIDGTAFFWGSFVCLWNFSSVITWDVINVMIFRAVIGKMVTRPVAIIVWDTVLSFSKFRGLVLIFVTLLPL